MDTTNCDMTAETLAKILDKLNEIDEKYKISATYNAFHGHWIKGSKSDEEVSICSFCGCGFYDIDENYHYCPNCGVRIEEVEE